MLWLILSPRHRRCVCQVHVQTEVCLAVLSTQYIIDTNLHGSRCNTAQLVADQDGCTNSHFRKLIGIKKGHHTPWGVSFLTPVGQRLHDKIREVNNNTVSYYSSISTCSFALTPKPTSRAATPSPHHQLNGLLAHSKELLCKTGEDNVFCIVTYESAFAQLEFRYIHQKSIYIRKDPI